MHTRKLQYSFGITLAVFCILVVPLQSQAATKGKHKVAQQSGKERLVLMPLRVPEEDGDLNAAMDTALVKGLQQKYTVFSGEQVAQKARAIYLKINRTTAVNSQCDETRCMQDIAEAFQAELIASANVTKKDGSYFLSLSIQNIFDNQVVQSETLSCEKCSPAQVIEKLKILSGVVASKANGSALRLSNNKAQPTTFPAFEQAQIELGQLNEKIASIEAVYEKELIDIRNKVNQTYSEKLDALENNQRDEFESTSEFSAMQEKKRNEIIKQKDSELARLDISNVAATETAPFKSRMNALNLHEYIVGAESIEALLGTYDADNFQFLITLNGKPPTFHFKIEGNIPLQRDEARSYSKLWHAGLVRPEAKVKLNGELVELSLVNDADNSRMNNYSGRFMTSRAAADEKRKMLKEGYVFQGGLTWMPASDSSKTWPDAVAYCNNTAINGQTGWRLPSKEELRSLYSSTAQKNWGIVPAFSNLWTSVPNAPIPCFPMVLNGVAFTSGCVEAEHVTCVRKSLSP